MLMTGMMPRAAARGAHAPRWHRSVLRPEATAGIATLVVWCVFAILAGHRGFVSLRGTLSYLEVAAQLGILAVAVALLMIAGEFDLSVGSIIGACSVIP